MEITNILIIDLVIYFVGGLVVPVVILVALTKVARRAPKVANKVGSLMEPLIKYTAIAIAGIVGLSILFTIGYVVYEWIGWIGLASIVVLILIFLFWDHRRVKAKKNTKEH